ncbi:hypothetical protein H6P81_006644 [Aristolochia fimbriata]|uniref:DUF7953 domain-containing protein n=1 Tax=Aristolochia fimbriata TaxID=158543 RepID=A0AAV7EXV6_ARIFI|nr:hypothetical protein H6P81_006644 [Aristolochia fimbriata]
MRDHFCSGIPFRVLLSWALFCHVPGAFFARVVTLDSLELFNTHEWLSTHPSVYFNCQGENKTFLPDVKSRNIVYKFKGAESWQPLTELPDNKCKRCGFYEEDTVKSDDIFDEWELCPDEFLGPGGKYVRIKEKEFSATFSCPECVHQPGDHVGSHKSKENHPAKGVNLTLVILVIVLAVIVSFAGMLAAYRYWQRRRREQDQARFLKLFEEGDDIEDELSLGQMI